MIAFPGIDLFWGRAVKLDPTTHSTKSRDYGVGGEVARKWLDQGATHLHVVDIDGALETGRSNRETAVAIQRMALGRGAQVYFGGGLRQARDIGECLNGYGIARAIIGTRAVTDLQWLGLVLRLFPERVVVAIDAVGGQAVVRGWQQSAGLDVVEFVKRARDWPVAAFLYTNVAVEGREQGVDWRPVETIMKATSKPMIFSGGITTLEEVRRFRALGAFGIVVGSALYKGSLRLPEVIAEAADGATQAREAKDA